MSNLTSPHTPSKEEVTDWG